MNIYNTSLHSITESNYYSFENASRTIRVKAPASVFFDIIILNRARRRLYINYYFNLSIFVKRRAVYSNNNNMTIHIVYFFPVGLIIIITL